MGDKPKYQVFMPRRSGKSIMQNLLKEGDISLRGSEVTHIIFDELNTTGFCSMRYSEEGIQYFTKSEIWEKEEDNARHQTKYLRKYTTREELEERKAAILAWDFSV